MLGRGGRRFGFGRHPMTSASRRRYSPGRSSAALGPPADMGVRVHLYAQCWNDAFMLPYFFRHYDGFVDRYVIFDDGSTDRSLAILRDHPRVKLRRFIRANPDSFRLSEQALSNGCATRTPATSYWVVVTAASQPL